MSRGLWFVAGAGAGIYAMVRGRRVVEAFTPDGLRDRAHGLAAGARAFREELAQGQADAEPVLRERMGLAPAGPAALAAPPPSATPTEPSREPAALTEPERGTT